MSATSPAAARGTPREGRCWRVPGPGALRRAVGVWGRSKRATGADVVVLDTEHPALVGRSGDELLDAWIFSGEDTPVRDVMVGGTWVVEDGRHRAQEGIVNAYGAVARQLNSTRQPGAPADSAR